MLRLRKIDCFGQLLLASCTLLSIPFLGFFGAGLELFFLACWQLISVLLNTHSFISSGYKKPILLYWILWVADLILITPLFFFENDFTGNLKMFIIWITIGTVAFTAGYYLRLYYRLIELISLRNELDGLTKSKH